MVRYGPKDIVRLTYDIPASWLDKQGSFERARRRRFEKIEAEWAAEVAAGTGPAVRAATPVDDVLGVDGDFDTRDEPQMEAAKDRVRRRISGTRTS